ncbi:Membrane protein involved in the export of O-antigen and teichoic acid [Methanolobus vulcani]|uniref:Membrane protein involved in the export of O-antigen and teichoic acid n=2 Tax=Methanolobus vulcani TaxID=38026 RepID=A0A7Z7AUN6_9EURY|nr:Membrane protein involved in the export of O-antigen and teichoic acid [Methanolobus vulcani]
MSKNVEFFFQNLTYVAIGTIIGNICLFAFNALGGRYLGPAEYGKFTLINSVATFLYIPMLFGMSSAIVKYNSETNEYHKQKSIISTTYILILVATIFSTLFYIGFSSKIADILSIHLNMFYFSILFALITALHTLTTNTLRSLHRMKIFSILKLIYGFALLFSFIIFIRIEGLSYKSMLFPMYISAIIISVYILVTNIRKYLALTFDSHWAKTLIIYSSYNIFNSVSFMLYSNIDKILINKYMFVENVGVYYAYNISSISIMNVLSGIIINVLFPTICKYEDKKNITNKINKFMPLSLLVGFVTIICTQYIILNIYGKQYPINFQLMLLFTIVSLLFFCYNTYMWIFNSLGIAGVKITMYGSVVIAIIDIILNIYLIPRYGLFGAIGSTALAYCAGLFVIYNHKNMI